MTPRGGRHTEETKKKISEAKRHVKNRPPLVPQLCACGCGEYATIDERRNRVCKYVSGHNSRVAHPMKGKHHTAEAKKKLGSYTSEKASSYKHGWAGTPTYSTWTAMRSRCYDPSNASYKIYGGRGITVCQRWRDDFMNFLADMGARPSKNYSLDRIDPTGNYEPGNCRWVTKTENSRAGGRNGARARWHS